MPEWMRVMGFISVMESVMRNAVNAVIDSVMVAIEGPVFRRAHSGYWTAEVDQTRREIQAVLEPAYGEGVFRVVWGVRAAGVQAMLDGQEIAGASHATVSGDAGSLATGRRRMHFLCPEGGKTSLINRVLWGLRPEPADVLAGRIRAWISEAVLPLMQSTTTRAAVAQVLESLPKGRHALIEPDLDGQRLPAIAALKALNGDKAGASHALDQWARLFEPGTLGYEQMMARHARMSAKVDAI